MSKIYNRFAGQSPERLAALSDGIFAVAMTLLVLNLHLPDLGNALLRSQQFLWQGNTLQQEGALWSALGPLGRSLIPYVMSFLTLGIFWVGQQTQLNLFKRTDRDLAWIHLGFLFAVSLMPFSTSFLAAFINYRVALVIYWFNIFLLGTMLLVSWKYAEHAELVPENMTAKLRSAIVRRIVVAQALYAFGALLCIINTYVSIVVIVLIQLNYAIAPRIRALYRL